MQTRSTKLQQKAIQDNPSYEISQEQAKKKADSLPDGECEKTRALETQVRKLTLKLNKEKEKRQGEEERKCKKCLLARCEGAEKCPAKTRTCNRCGELGHFSKSMLCKGKTKGLRKVQEEESSEEDIPRLKEETEAGELDSRIRVSLGVTKQGDSFRGVNIEVLADTGVRRTILNLGDWEKLGGGELKRQN